MLGELYDGEFESMEHNGRMDACMSSEYKESEVTTTCSDCQYNAYRMLGEEAKKLRKPDNCGEHYYPFSQNGKIVQVVTYIQCAYRDGYKHGYKDGYKIGFEDGQADADGKNLEYGYKQGYQEAILNSHLMTPEEAKDEFNFEQGKLEGRLEALASIKDLCNSLESEEISREEIAALLARESEEQS